MGYLIGADIGSQSVKVSDEDPDGRTGATAELPDAHPAGVGRAAPADWQTGLTTGCGRCREARVARQTSRSSAWPARSTAWSPSMPTCGRFDPHHLARPAGDPPVGRASARGRRTSSSRDRSNPDASHTAPKAMWLREQEPEIYARTDGSRRSGAPDRLAHRGRSPRTTRTLRRRCSTICGAHLVGALVESAGLDADRLPPIRPAADVIGTLTAEAADALALSTSCRVAVGTGDDHARRARRRRDRSRRRRRHHGHGRARRRAATEIVLDDERLVETHAHAVDDRLLVENPGFVSGGSTRWLAQLFGVTQAELFARAEAAPPGADGVLFLPSLSGATAPRWNDRMRGAFGGLALSHDFASMARGVLEGCAFALRDIARPVCDARARG